jgi:hypothetical protein
VVTLVPEPRTELLYSTSKNVGLHGAACDGVGGPSIPRRPARVLNDGAPIDLSTVKLQWSFKGKALGSLAADLDLGPTRRPSDR